MGGRGRCGAAGSGASRPYRVVALADAARGIDAGPASAAIAAGSFARLQRVWDPRPICF